MRLILALIFFLSGVAALIFESLWFRLAGLSLGNSVWSASLVLAAFMGGLALGNGLVARLHESVRRPIAAYAGLEFAIGIGGVAVVLLLPRLPGLLSPVLGSLTDLPAVLNALRLTLAFALLLIPAVAMGATLPVLAQALQRRSSNFGANIGWLYGWNTLGATLAAFGTELLIVPTFGIAGSGLLALSINMLAGLIALRLSRAHEAEPAPLEKEAREQRTLSAAGRRYLFVAFGSGALMLALEVVWFRFLLLTRDGTSFLFGVMLAIVLAGIAIGGLAASYLFARDDRSYRWLPQVVSMSAILVVVTYWGYDGFAVYRNTVAVPTPAFVGMAAFLMFPVAALSGVAFTMVSRAVKDDFGSSARTSGFATFANTTGAMLGSLIAGFLLLPLAGMELSFFLIGAGYCLLAVAVPRATGAARGAFAWRSGAVIAAIASLVLFPFGMMKATYFDDEIAMLPRETLVAYREGLTETSRYYRRDVHGETGFYRLVTNSFSMSATSTAAKRYMKLYVYLPLALKADTEDALLISFGVGSTAKALTDSAGLRSIDVVDISEDVLEMSRVVYPGSDNPLEDERVRVHVEDGRFYLNTTDKRYDLITSEPPPPKHAGIVNLYSQEYFALIRERLKPGGYTSYWLPVQQLEPVETLAIAKAFCNVFDDCSLWSGAGLEWMLLGSRDAPAPDGAAEFSAQWQDPVVARELSALGLESPGQLGSLFIADADLLAELTADVAPVKDNFPARISGRQVSSRRFIELYAQLMDEGERLERFRESRLIERLWPAAMRQRSEPYFAHERMIRTHFTPDTYRHRDDPYVWDAIDDLLTNTSLTTLPLWLLGSDRVTQDIVDTLVERHGQRDDLLLDLARIRTAERDYSGALEHAEKHLDTRGEMSAGDMQLFLYLLAKSGRTAQAEPLIASLENSGWPEMDRFLGWYASRFASPESAAARVGAAASP